MNAIDWDFWRAMPGAKLDEACALSLNIDPAFLKTTHYYGMTGPAYLPESFPDAKVQRDFNNRLRVLKSRQWKLRGSNVSGVVPLPEVAELGTSYGWEMPSEMGAMCMLVAPPKCAATPESQAAPVVSDSASNGTETRWTPERKAAARAMMEKLKGQGVKAYAAKTADAFKVTPTRLRYVLNDKAKKTPAKKTGKFWPR